MTAEDMEVRGYEDMKVLRYEDMRMRILRYQDIRTHPGYKGRQKVANDCTHVEGEEAGH